jgi:hypothetical protein
VAALRVAQTLFAVTLEFSITNQLMNNKMSIPEIRSITEESLPKNPPPVVGYTAIVYVFMNGARDPQHNGGITSERSSASGRVHSDCICLYERCNGLIFVAGTKLGLHSN